MRWPRFDFSEPIGRSRAAGVRLAPTTAPRSRRRPACRWRGTRASEMSRGLTARPTPSARRIARAWPSRDGTSMPRPRPSFDRPTPRMTPWIVSPSRMRVVEPAQRDEAAPSAGTRPSASRWNGRERPAAAERAERGEAEVDEQVVGAVDRAGEHHVGGAVVEPVAGELDGVEAARAGRVERERAGAEPERPLQHQRRQPGQEPVARIGAVANRPVRRAARTRGRRRSTRPGSTRPCSPTGTRGCRTPRRSVPCPRRRVRRRATPRGRCATSSWKTSSSARISSAGTAKPSGSNTSSKPRT